MSEIELARNINCVDFRAPNVLYLVTGVMCSPVLFEDNLFMKMLCKSVVHLRNCGEDPNLPIIFRKDECLYRSRCDRDVSFSENLRSEEEKVRYIICTTRLFQYAQQIIYVAIVRSLFHMMD